MYTLLAILQFVGMLAIIIGAYLLCRKFVFSKIRVNKFIPLAISIVLFIIQVLGKSMKLFDNLGITVMVISVLAVLFFLWFMDIVQTGGPKKTEKKIVIKPKAKPNRVKNNKK